MNYFSLFLTDLHIKLEQYLWNFFLVLCPNLHLIPNSYIRIISIIHNLASIWLMNFLAFWFVCVYMCERERECVSVCIIHRGSLKEKAVYIR